MKHFLHVLTVLLMGLMLMTTTSAPVWAEPNPAPAQTAAQKKAKAQAKKEKEKAKAQAKKEKEKAKKAKAKEKAQAKKAKEKEKTQAKKQKAKDKTAAQKAKAQLKKTKEAQKKALAKQKEQQKKQAQKQKEMEQQMKEQAKQQMIESAKTTAVAPADGALAAEGTPQHEEHNTLQGNAPIRARKFASQDLHYLTLWGQGGYSGMHGNYDPAQGSAQVEGVSFESSFRGNTGAALGIGYGLKHNNFLFRVGPEFRLLGSEDMLKLEQNLEIAHPDYPQSMTMFYHFKGLREDQAVGQVMLPIMAGMNIDKYYWLAGVKVGYTLMSNYHVRGELTTTVKEMYAIDGWGEMITHELVSDEYMKHPLTAGGKGKSGLNALDVALSLEGGVILSEFFSDDWKQKNQEKAHPWVMRLGAFIDYGLPLAAVGGEGQSLVLDPQTGVLSSQSLHNSEWATGKLSSLLVGVKFTAEMQLNQPKSPDPRMTIYVHNEFTDSVIAGAKIEVMDPYSNRSMTKYAATDGGMQERVPLGDYNLMATAPGYLPGHVQHYTLAGDLQDTIHLSLIPVPELLTYVHDSKSEVLIAANLTYTSHVDNDDYEAFSYGDQPAKANLTYGETYKLKIEAEGYHDFETEVSNLYGTIHYQLDPLIRVRRTLVLKNMYFATAKADILPGSEEDIERLYNFLVENPAIRVQIVGHTDSQGNDNYNQKLSEARAMSLKNVMVERGIDAERIETDGMGESMPIDTNDTEAGRQNNRRIEVTVLNAEDAEEDVY